MKHILRKVQIVVGKGTSHIVIHLVSALRNLLKFRYYHLIASLSAAEGAHFIMYLLTSVDAQNNIRHFPVGKFQNVII